MNLKIILFLCIQITQIVLYFNNIIIKVVSLLKKLILYVDFVLNFFLGNTYKFYYEKKIVENCCQFFCNIFCIKYFSQ